MLVTKLRYCEGATYPDPKDANVELSEVSTGRLIEELLNRDGVIEVEVGRYKNYHLRTTFDPIQNREIDAEKVLLVNPRYL